MMESDSNIISSLIERRSFHHILIQILINLENESILNFACTCKLWSRFVEHNIRNNKYFEAKRLHLNFRTKTPSVWIIACGQYVSCMEWTRDIVVIGRAQSATYTADPADTKDNMLTPLIFVYSRPGRKSIKFISKIILISLELVKIHSLYGHRKGVTSLAISKSIIISGSLDRTVR